MPRRRLSNAAPSPCATSEGSSDSTLRRPDEINISALRPQSHDPIRAAFRQLWPCASSVAHTPVKTSPIPPHAIPALPVGLYEIDPPLSPKMVLAPFRSRVTGKRDVKSSTKARRDKLELSEQSRFISPGWGVSRRGPAHCARIVFPCMAMIFRASASTTAGPGKSRTAQITCCSLRIPKPGPIPSESAFNVSTSRGSSKGTTMHSAGVRAQTFA